VPAIRTARSLSEVIGHVSDLFASLRPDLRYLWFRGVRSNAFHLVPGIYRASSISADTEQALIADFEVRAPALDVFPAGNWDRYVAMQHYGLPTRLLDWTESLLVALYIAIFDRLKSGEDTVPCVWVLDPFKVNDLSVKHHVILIPHDAGFSHWWLPQYFFMNSRKPTRFQSGGRRYSTRGPLAIAPPLLNRRISAQRGVFTVHGEDPTSLDDFFWRIHRRSKYSACLARIDIVDNLAEIYQDIKVLGVDRSAVFPELSSLAEDLKERHAIDGALLTSRAPSAVVGVVAPGPGGKASKSGRKRRAAVAGRRRLASGRAKKKGAKKGAK
jgi:hypothetical protein